MITTGKLGIVRTTGEDTTALRLAVFTRDNYHCVECERRVFPNAALEAPRKAHMAHIEGRGSGGSDTLDNLRTLCGVCHLINEHNPKCIRRKEGKEKAND
jgi:5-methylcytosine-specific restriction endonuclease McrA